MIIVNISTPGCPVRRKIAAGLVMNCLRILLFTVMFCAVLSGAATEVPVGVVHYQGHISAEHNRQFFAAVAGQTHQRLSITSSGGEVAAAIALGEWVFSQQLDLEVPDYCLSSCANYVFPAAHQKLVHAGAIVAWHGNYRHLQQTGLWREDIDARMQRHGEDEQTATRKARAQLEELVGLERAFFAHIGVDEYLCWIGKLPPYNVPDYYFLSVHDMARFGVERVQVPPDYAHTDVSRFTDSIVYIELE